MTKDDLRRYIDAFNRKEFEAFGAFYKDDVVLDVGKFRHDSRAAILEFYRNVAKVCDEKLTLQRIVMDEDGAAIVLDTEFKALADKPDFIAGPLQVGQSIFITSFIFYEIEGDKFAHITARRVTDAVHAPSTF